MRSNCSLVRFQLFLTLMLLLGSLSGAQTTESQTNTSRPTRIKIGGNVELAKLLTKVQPNYPDEAKRRHIQGRVVLHAIVSTDGTIKELNILSGPQELTESALDAVKQWRYQPTLLNGNPVEVDTTITVDYQLPPSLANVVAPSDAPVSADDSAALQAKEREALAAVDPETATDIRHLLEITGAANLMSQIFNSQMPLIKAQLLQTLPPGEDREQIADRFIKKMEDRVSSGELVDVLIPIYVKHFTHDDVKNILAFFDSPTGRRFLQESPAYVQEVQTAASEHWKKVVLPQLLREMAAEFPDIAKPK